ncbi:hypothetical protein E2R51_07130 [Jeotgalibacillus sp. S-D1]|uniref:hypothetical protein n=1 Tax=Jeotgalibacillus sp. S-D1 TaxID=2552189 RepID=UPI00105A6E43|nr:hypothetical protein [Jeotgalibacillus sp. S-D1]TDL32456.1 hypothetical protein E2R51_07130 [Jeotgalibacillus sp. S-D1]
MCEKEYVLNKAAGLKSTLTNDQSVSLVDIVQLFGQCFVSEFNNQHKAAAAADSPASIENTI